jgi:hypothetical protein
MKIICELKFFQGINRGFHGCLFRVTATCSVVGNFEGTYHLHLLLWSWRRHFLLKRCILQECTMSQPRCQQSTKLRAIFFTCVFMLWGTVYTNKNAAFLSFVLVLLFYAVRIAAGFYLRIAISASSMGNQISVIWISGMFHLLVLHSRTGLCTAVVRTMQNALGVFVMWLNLKQQFIALNIQFRSRIIEARLKLEVRYRHIGVK